MPAPSFSRLAGLPPYVLAQVDELSASLRARGEDVYDFGLGNPDHGSPPQVVARLVREAPVEANHRYAPSPGVAALRQAIARWYLRRYGVTLDPVNEAVVTLGAKEGLGQLLYAIVSPGDAVLAPDPSYPIHRVGVQLAGGEVVPVAVGPGCDPVTELEAAYARAPKAPRLAIVNFPHNPTGQTVSAAELEGIVRWAERRDLWLVSDLAYADLLLDDGKPAPSILAVPGARERACEFFTVSKSYNMPGWRVGFCVGNPTLVGALKRIKGYLDYGHFTPVQLGAVTALDECDAAVAEVRTLYRARRDALIAGLHAIGWEVPPPAGTMFVWAPLPERFRAAGSVDFALKLLERGRVAVTPGVGFGAGGEGYVRFALVEEVERTAGACAAIGNFLRA